MPLYFLKLYNLTPLPPLKNIAFKFSFQLNQVSYEKTVDVIFLSLYIKLFISCFYIYCKRIYIFLFPL